MRRIMALVAMTRYMVEVFHVCVAFFSFNIQVTPLERENRLLVIEAAQG